MDTLHQSLQAAQLNPVVMFRSKIREQVTCQCRKAEAVMNEQPCFIQYLPLSAALFPITNLSFRLEGYEVGLAGGGEDRI